MPLKIQTVIQVVWIWTIEWVSFEAFRGFFGYDKQKKGDQVSTQSPFFYRLVIGYYPIAFTCFINLLLRLEALFLCQVFFFASLSIIATTFGKYFTASVLSSKALNLAMAVLADFL